MSACGTALCKDGKGAEYTKMSGTSMACPHTTGVIAQLLQKKVTASEVDLMHALTCEAADNELNMVWSVDTVSRNQLLQVPHQTDTFDKCDLGVGCPKDCSQVGVCSFVQNATRQICQCDKSYGGDDCATKRSPCSPESSNALVMQMADDGQGGGWFFARYAITDIAKGGLVADFAIDSCPTQQQQTPIRSYCLPAGNSYALTVTRGLQPTEVAWKLCDYIGGAPFSGKMSVDGKGGCTFLCDGGSVKVPLTLDSSTNDGWHGAYFALYVEKSGKQFLGGSLPLSEPLSQPMCLQASTCYVFLIELKGDKPKSLAYQLCGFTGTYKDTVRVCIDAKGTCTVTPITPPPIEGCDVAQGGTSIIGFDLLSPSLRGWGNDTISLVSKSNPAEVHVASFGPPALLSSVSTCLTDGCYHLKVGEANQTALYQPGNFWLACNTRGTVPWNAQLCVDSAYGLCYGLKGCPTIKSYARTSASQWYVVYDEVTGALADINNVHGANEICELTDGCYQVFVGAGEFYDEDAYTSVDLCGTPMTLNSRAKMCVTNTPMHFLKYG